jgi:hypothetical protein
METEVIALHGEELKKPSNRKTKGTKQIYGLRRATQASLSPAPTHTQTSGYFLVKTLDLEVRKLSWTF